MHTVLFLLSDSIHTLHKGFFTIKFGLPTDIPQFTVFTWGKKVPFIDISIMSITLLLDRIRKILPVCAAKVKELVSFVKKYFDRILKDIEKLSEEEDDMQYKYDDAKKKVKKVFDCASAYVDAINDIFHYTNKADKKEIKQSIKKGDLKLLEELLRLLSHYIDRTVESFKNFKQASADAEKSCIELAKRCKKLARDEGKNKTITKVAGGTGSAVLIGGGITAAVVTAGVALSVVAGVFTFGIGTALGLGLTAAGVGGGVAATGIGVGTAIATHEIAEYFGEKEMLFTDYADKFDNLYRSAVDVNNCCQEIKVALKPFLESFENVQKFYDEDFGAESLSKAVELLFRKFADCSSTISQQLLSIKKLNTETT